MISSNNLYLPTLTSILTGICDPCSPCQEKKGNTAMFKEGNRECMDKLLRSSRYVLETGAAIRAEPYDKRMALWQEIKTNAERYRKGDCGTFLSDLNAHFSARFDASLLLLALTCKQNSEQFEGFDYFSAREVEAFETTEKFRYFRILSKKEIAKKIILKDEKTLTLLREYSASINQRMDEILSDPEVRDSIRSYLKKQWDENSKKVGEAISIAGVDLDWFASLPPTTREAYIPPHTIIINAGKDAVINTGQGTVVKDAVVTGSSIESAGGGTTVQDSVITKSHTQSSGRCVPGSGVKIQDSVVTSSTIKNVQEKPVEPLGEPEQQSIQPMCLLCGIIVNPGAKFCRICGAKISGVCGRCGFALPLNVKFCPQCGQKIS
jgi:hypothetical protein